MSTHQSGKILVTGGAGYIGSHAVRHLLESGYQVTVADNLSSGSELLVDSRADFQKGDLRDLDFLKTIFRNQTFQGVIHFAASVDVAESVREPVSFYENNLLGTIHLLKLCQEHQVQNFVFSSTAAVYKDPGTGAVTENSETGPITPYGKSKLWCESMIRDLAYVSNLKFTILRYFNVAGASLDLKLGQLGNHQTVLIKRVAQVAAGIQNEVSVFGQDFSTKDGTGVRDFIHVEDLAEVHRLAFEYLLHGGASETMNVGYGSGFSVLDVIQTMESVCGHKLNKKILPRREGDLAQVVANSSKAMRLLKWTPRLNDLTKICKTAYEWEVKMKGRVNAKQ